MVLQVRRVFNLGEKIEIGMVHGGPLGGGDIYFSIWVVVI